MKIYSIKDVKVGFGNPFVSPAEAVAVRSFTKVVNNPNTEIGAYYEDMELWEIGEYDEVTGIITPCEPTYKICGKDVKTNEI